ncbi:MAG: hypothetical protein FD168_640 [Desulfobulbaceae bacterium]|nr:MAG: hypothetical protein FD168_640 [Desulfobulbaceae bacterium]
MKLCDTIVYVLSVADALARMLNCPRILFPYNEILPER